jgi:hypothetical protein
MNEQAKSEINTQDDHANNADIKNQDPKKPHYLNSPLHVPKLNSGVDNVKDVTSEQNGAE